MLEPIKVTLTQIIINQIFIKKLKIKYKKRRRFFPLIFKKPRIKYKIKSKIKSKIHPITRSTLKQNRRLSKVYMYSLSLVIVKKLSSHAS